MHLRAPVACPFNANLLYNFPPFFLRSAVIFGVEQFRCAAPSPNAVQSNPAPSYSFYLMAFARHIFANCISLRRRFSSRSPALCRFASFFGHCAVYEWRCRMSSHGASPLTISFTFFLIISPSVVGHPCHCSLLPLPSRFPFDAEKKMLDDRVSLHRMRALARHGGSVRTKDGK